jgi:predicted DNA-binding protein
MNLTALGKASGRTLAAELREQIEAQQHQAMRWTISPPE